MFDQLISQFTQSAQGQSAFSRLTQQGFAPHQASQFLGAAVPAAAQSFHQAQTQGGAGARPGGPGGLLDVGNSHYVTNFLSGAVTGLIRGEGMMGAAVDGMQAVAGGHVAQVIATRFGLPQRVAGTVGAIVTPLVIDFLWERVGGGLDLGSLFGGGSAAPSPPAGFGGGAASPPAGFGGAPAFGGGQAPPAGFGGGPAFGGAPAPSGFGGAGGQAGPGLMGAATSLLAGGGAGAMIGAVSQMMGGAAGQSGSFGQPPAGFGQPAPSPQGGPPSGGGWGSSPGQSPGTNQGNPLGGGLGALFGHLVRGSGS